MTWKDKTQLWSPEEYIYLWAKTFTTSDDPKLIRELRELLDTDEDVANVLLILEDTCTKCWDGSSRCQCWNDK